jgi:hypothetical protein
VIIFENFSFALFTPPPLGDYQLRLLSFYSPMKSKSCLSLNLRVSAPLPLSEGC